MLIEDFEKVKAAEDRLNRTEAQVSAGQLELDNLDKKILRKSEESKELRDKATAALLKRSGLIMRRPKQVPPFTGCPNGNDFADCDHAEAKEAYLREVAESKRYNASLKSGAEQAGNRYSELNAQADRLDEEIQKLRARQQAKANSLRQLRSDVETV